MTAAICFNCGDFKFGAWTRCEKCGALPQNEDDRVLSLAMTDHYFDRATLQQMGDHVKTGRRPKLDPETHANLLEGLRQTDAKIGSLLSSTEARQGQKPWWKFW